jgi:dTMP kinase
MRAAPARPTIEAAWDKGVVVAICGIDGSGKSTVAESLAGSLAELGVATTLTRQPTDYYRGDPHVRRYHDDGEGSMWEEGLALLSACDRLLHLREEVVPALEAGHVVISDRFLHATQAIFRARGVCGDWLATINSYCPPPHLCVLLDCPVPVALERIRLRGGYIRLEERSPDRLEVIRQSYLEVVPPDAAIIDATASPDDLHRAVLAAVEPLVVARPGLCRR